MGYYMDYVHSVFTIPQDKEEECLRALQEKYTEQQVEGVRREAPPPAKSLDEAFVRLDWQSVRARDGAIVHLSFEGEKLGEEDIIFNIIAPFVESGSYIEMQGEEGDRWRWRFDDGKMYTQESERIWLDDQDNGMEETVRATYDLVFSVSDKVDQLVSSFRKERQVGSTDQDKTLTESEVEELVDSMVHRCYQDEDFLRMACEHYVRGCEGWSWDEHRAWFGDEEGGEEE